MRNMPVFCVILAVAIACLVASPQVNADSFDVDGRFTPVSVAVVGDDTFAVADYKHLYLVNKASSGAYRLNILPIVSGDIAIQVQNFAWTNGYYNPTGVEYDSDSNSLFIANYAGRNILIADITGSPPVAAIRKQITHPDLKSPENVSVRGDRIAVADYDASAIFMFDRAGTLLWRYPLSLAHGVLIADDAVYATGLGGDRLIKLSVNGELIAKAGDDLLYPTQIVEDGPDLAVIDANAGAVVKFDRNLSRLAASGSNGPALAQFHRPYGIAITDKHQIVADTYKNRIVLMSRAGEIETVISQSSPTIMGVSAGYGQKPNPYCSNQVASDAIMSLLDSAYRLPPEISGKVGYQVVCLLSGDAVYASALMPFSTSTHARYRPSIPLGFTWQHAFKYDGREIVAFGAPDSRSIQIFDAAGPVFLNASTPPGLQIWSIDRGAKAMVEGLVANALDDFAAKAEKCDGNIFAAYLDSVLVTDEKTFNLPADRILSMMLYWADKESLVETWRSGGNLDAAFGDWIAKGRPILVEDAVWLALMRANSFADTQSSLATCRSGG